MVLLQLLFTLESCVFPGSIVHKEAYIDMRNYELMCVFRPEDEVFNRGRDDVRNELQKLNVTVVKEDDMGQRTLAYPIKDTHQAHYHLFVTEMAPDMVAPVEAALRHKDDLLRFMVVRQEE